MTDTDYRHDEQSCSEEENDYCTLSDEELDARLEEFIGHGSEDYPQPMTFRQLEILHRRTKRENE